MNKKDRKLSRTFFITNVVSGKPYSVRQGNKMREKIEECKKILLADDGNADEMGFVGATLISLAICKEISDNPSKKDPMKRVKALVQKIKEEVESFKEGDFIRRTVEAMPPFSKDLLTKYENSN